jgi:ADP-ribosylglycohydrolase
MLLAVAIGDSYGASFEFAPREFVEKYNTADKYVSSPKYFKNKRLGRYTDDSQQSLAIAELLLDDVEWTHLNIANKLVEVYKRDPRGGYGKGSYMALSQAANGEEFMSLINGDSEKCGGAMRAMPIGFLPTVDEVLESAITQAELTHNSPDGIDAAMTSALMSHYFIHKLGPKSQLCKFLFNHVNYHWENPFDKEIVSTNGMECVHAAVSVVMKSNSLKEVLKNSVSYCGDVDSVASIAMAAAVYCDEIKRSVPRPLYNKLENGTYGRDYLASLDERLKAKYLKGTN